MVRLGRRGWLKGEKLISGSRSALTSSDFGGTLKSVGVPGGNNNELEQKLLQSHMNEWPMLMINVIAHQGNAN